LGIFCDYNPDSELKLNSRAYTFINRTTPATQNKKKIRKMIMYSL